jgi:hypothetical protein
MPPAHITTTHPRYALNTLMNIFSSPSLPGALRQATLSQLVRTLLLRLVDDNLGAQAEGEALLKVCVCVCVCLRCGCWAGGWWVEH